VTHEPSDLPAAWGRREIAAAALVLAIALALRFAHVATIASEPAVRYPVLDALAYHEWALEILAGNWLGDRIYYQDPLYPFFLAGLYAIFGPGSIGVLLAQSALDAVSAVLLFATARRLFGAMPALVAGLLAAGYAPFLYFSSLLLKAPLKLFLFDLTFLLLVRAAQMGRPRQWLAAGFAFGLAALARGNALLFAPVLLAWIALDRARSRSVRANSAALACAGIAFAILPVAARNLVVGGELVLLNSQAGQNFYIGNFRGNDTGGYRAPPFLHADPRYEEEDFAREAEKELGRKLSPAEVSRYWWGRGLDEIRADPGHFVRHASRKLLVLVNHHEIADNYSFDFIAEVAAPLLSWPLPRYGVLLPLALCGAAFAGRRRDALLLQGFALAYASSLLLFFNLSRLRLPIVPIVIVFAGYALVELARRVQRREPRGVAPALVFLLVAYPIVHLDVAVDRQSIRYSNLGQRHMAIAFEHQRRAVELSKQGDERAARAALAEADRERDEAEAVFRRGLAADPTSRRLRTGLRDLMVARITNHYRLAQYPQAVALAEGLVRMHPNDAAAHAWLGAAQARLGNREEAEAHLARALAIDPAHELAREELRRLRKGAADLEEATR
jgi:4-amino-4-deoxy-L-arabinose transferase-like glycosyltransferase